MKSSRKPQVLLAAFGAALVAAVAATAGLLWREPARAPFEPTGSSNATARSAQSPRSPESAPSSSPESSSAASAFAREAQAFPEAAKVEPLVIEVRAQDDAPVSGARVALFRTGELLGSASTDELGCATLAASSGTGLVVVLARASVPHTEELDLASGRRVIVLARGTVVSGRIRVNGAPPSAPLSVRLDSDRPLVDPSALPEALLAALELGSSERLRLRQDTDADGAFEFTGLSRPWSGLVRVPDTLWIVSIPQDARTLDPRTVRFEEPLENAVIDAVALPLLRGRVVTAAGGEPIPNARVDANVRYLGAQDGSRGVWASGRAGDDGRFEIGVPPPSGMDADELAPPARWPAVQSIELRVASEHQSRPKIVQVPRERLVPPWDAGDVELGPHRRIEFLVHDAAGAPLAGAVAYLRVASDPTDASGRGHLDAVPADAKKMSVGLAGYREADVDLPAELVSPIEVALEACNRLELVCSTEGGEPVENVQLTISSPAPLFPARRGGRPANTHTSTGASVCVNSWQNDAAWVSRFQTDARGRVVLCDVLAGQPLAVVASDALGQPLAQQTVSVGASEQRTVSIDLGSGVAFAGRVSDEQGLTLAGAEVRISPSAGGRTGSSRTTDASGRFLFERVVPAHVRLEVRREGFSPLQIADYDLPVGGPPVEFQLQRALRVVVRVVGDDGRLVPATSMTATAEDHPKMNGRRRDASRFEFRSLPPESVRIEALVGGRLYARALDPLLGDADLVVPAHGAAEVRLVSDEPLDAARRRVLLLDRSGAKFSLRQDLAASPLGPRTVFDALLPGDYNAILEVLQPGRAREQWQRAGKGVRFTVEAGVTASVELRP